MLRILIAEDEPLEQQSLKDILEWNFSCGVDIKTASNGVDAISTATIWHADLVLMDIEMPGCNGIVAANKIAKVNPPMSGLSTPTRPSASMPWITFSNRWKMRFWYQRFKD